MNRKIAEPPPSDSEPGSFAPKQSSVRRVVIRSDRGEAPSSGIEHVDWPADSDQDLIPTEPENDPPSPPSDPPAAPEAPAGSAGRTGLAVDLPPPGHEVVRDTIPSPPPDEPVD